LYPDLSLTSRANRETTETFSLFLFFVASFHHRTRHQTPHILLKIKFSNGKKKGNFFYVVWKLLNILKLCRVAEMKGKEIRMWIVGL